MTGQIQTSDTHFDVIVVGAGLSGIGAGVHLTQQCPGKSFVLLEGREQTGGTWSLFRYPGIRSDSDMHTMGYSFRPWRDAKAIADGPAILKYIRETAAEYHIDERIRTAHRVHRADWSSETASWSLTVRRTDTEETLQYTCNVLYMCAGYYSYKGGYTPHFPGQDQFQGPIIHPQKWPDDLDYGGKRVVVIGSGATAITLIPAMSDKAEHITMLQRSPTYVFAWPDKDCVANTLNAVLPAQWAYDLTRWKNIALQQHFYGLSQKHPQRAKAQLLKRVRRQLGPTYDVDTHFHPRYNPWEQRLCLSPNGDLFDALKSGRAEVVTDEIETFIPHGIRLTSGATLEADIIVTATGLNLVLFGDVTFFVDGQPIDFSKTWSYKGIAISDVPNFFACAGYVNASWTLRADLTSQFLCRVLNHMDHTSTHQCTPRLRESDRRMPQRDGLGSFSPGYFRRVQHLFPMQSEKEPWLNDQNYKKDKLRLRFAPLEDGVLTFTRRSHKD